MKPGKQPAPAWAHAQLRLRSAVGAWIRASMARQRLVPWQGGHDEGAFTASWFGCHLLAGDDAVPDFLRWLRDGFLQWAQENLVHGYYPEGEVHHQPENFIFFLPRLWAIDPDPSVAAALDDAAHHAGNWVADVPPWYDWEHHRFRSWRLGTRSVGAAPPDDLERPDHFRIIQMVLCAFRAQGDERYLDLARDFCGRWARDILAADTLPAVRPLSQDDAAAVYPADLVQAAEAPPEARLELHVGAGTTDVLLDLFSVVHDENLAAAARKILAGGVNHVGEPYSHPLAAALRRYRIATGDTSLDAEIVRLVGSAHAEVEAAMLIGAPSGPHPMGIGQRRDQVRWLVSADGERWHPERRPSPPALALAWDITGDERLAAQAMSMAAGRMELAASALDDGRGHACGGRSVSAVASGHGRSAGIGEVTGVLYPLVLGAFRCFGADQPQVVVCRDHGPGLPEGCGALWRHGRPPTLLVCNVGEEPARLVVKATPAMREARPAPREVALEPGELVELEIGGS